jgi:hypothetical protein
MNNKEYVPVKMTVYYAKGTRKICSLCGAKRDIEAMIPETYVTGRFISWQCRWKNCKPY